MIRRARAEAIAALHEAERVLQRETPPTADDLLGVLRLVQYSAGLLAEEHWRRQRKRGLPTCPHCSRLHLTSVKECPWLVRMRATALKELTTGQNAPGNSPQSGEWPHPPADAPQ